MTRRLITFLGLPPRGHETYFPLTYALPGGNSTVETPFVARAIAELMSCDEVVVMATRRAEDAQGEHLKTRLDELGIRPRLCNIPDGQNEAELREQFRALTETAGDAQGGLVIDITHGFRAQPFFAATALATLAASGDLPKDTCITYGAMEAKDDNGVTPIWDLTPFLMLQDLAHGIATLKNTGHGGPLISALRRETERLSQRKRAGERDDYDRSNALVGAVAAFCDDLATLRVPMLTIGGDRTKSSARRLGEAIGAFRETCKKDHPALVPLLDDLAEMAGALPVPTLFGEEGQRAMVALARVYLQFNRPLEAAAVAREGYVSAFAAGPEATDGGSPAFDAVARRDAEARAIATDAGRDIGDIRNDLLHAAMRAAPKPASAMRRNAEAAVDTLAATSQQPPGHAAAPRALFVTRHPGAVEWARRQGIEADPVAHLDPAEVRPGQAVIGTLPVHLAARVCARGGRYLHLVLDLPPDARGRDLSAEDMEHLGARLEEYRVSAAGRDGRSRRDPKTAGMQDMTPR